MGNSTKGTEKKGKRTFRICNDLYGILNSFQLPNLTSKPKLNFPTAINPIVDMFCIKKLKEH